MNTRRFGRTGLEISELTLGGGFVGGLLLHARDDEKRACIAACLGAGVNLIDTAAAYGNGESEKALNWLLGELPADERPHASTKIRLDRTRHENFDDQIRTSTEASLTRLGMERADLLTLHNPLTREPGPDTLSLDEALRGRGLPRPPFAARVYSITSASPRSATLRLSAPRPGPDASMWRRSNTTC